MAKLLLRLNDAPEDEAEEVRALLHANGIEFYETSAGRWGISVAAIWLRHADDYHRARSLLDAYQTQRSATARAAYAERIRSDTQETIWSRALANPIRFLIYVGLVALLLYLTLAPFLFLGG